MKSIDDILMDEIQSNNTPSVQYLFFNKDSIIHTFVSGLIDIKANKDATPQSAYHAFSVTKTFTAVAVLQLAEQNQIDINQPAIKYLPTFPYGDKITIRNLLTHTSGIPNPIPLNWIHLESERKSFNRYDFFKEVFKKHNELKTTPGSKFAYSNLGYIFLGQIIEKVSGKSYEDYIDQNILSKIDVPSGEIGFEVKTPEHNAKGYHKKLSFSNFVLGFLIDKPTFMNKTEGKWKTFESYYVNDPAYGGLICTPSALAKYIQSLLSRDSKIISDRFKKEMFTENITTKQKKSGMSLAWYTGKLDDKQYFHHAGGGGGYYCEIRIYPEHGYGSVIMFNRTGMTDERFLDKVDRFAFENLN